MDEGPGLQASQGKFDRSRGSLKKSLFLLHSVDQGAFYREGDENHLNKGCGIRKCCLNVGRLQPGNGLV